MTRFSLPIVLLMLGACAAAPVTLRNPFTGSEVTIDPQGYAERRAQVELAVKSEFTVLLADIRSGGGPVLTAAFDAAAVPLDERAARTVQLQGDIGVFDNNPDALISQLLLFGA